MIVDTSAVMTILFGESEAERYDKGDSGSSVLPHVGRQLPGGGHRPRKQQWRRGWGHELDAFLEEAEIELAPVTPYHAQAARRAWRRFGKGNHPAGLNFGDCFAYALAEATQEPFLFKGRDFALTDIEAA